MEYQGSNNCNRFKECEIAQLTPEMNRHTPSQPRKKSRQCQLNGSFSCQSTDQPKMSHPVKSRLNNSETPRLPSWSYAPVNKNTNFPAETAERNVICAATSETNVVAARPHHVEMTLFGAVCFHPKCMTRLGSRINTVSDNTLRSHFDEAKCFTGLRPNCANLVRDLSQDLSTLRDLVLAGGLQADQLVEKVLPGNGVTRSKGSYCINCGLVGRPGQLRKKHFAGKKDTTCNIEHLRCNTIVKNPTIKKMKIPQEVVNLVRQGKFVYDNWNIPASLPSFSLFSTSGQQYIHHQQNEPVAPGVVVSVQKTSLFGFRLCSSFSPRRRSRFHCSRR